MIYEAVPASNCLLLTTADFRIKLTVDEFALAYLIF